MAYAQQSDLTSLRMTATELVQLTDDDNTGEVDSDIVSAALQEASGKIDSYCRNRYVTPLQQSDSVTALCLDIATYILFSRRRNANPKEIVRQRYEDAIAFLKDIASGKAQIDQPAAAQIPQSAATGPQISERDHHLRFREKEIEGFI